MLFTCLSLFERKIESKEDIILHVKSLLKLWTKLLRIFSIDSILQIYINHLYRSHLQFLLSLLFSVKFHIFLVFKKCIEKIKGGSNGWKRRELCSFLSKKNEKLKAKNISSSGLSSNFLAFDQRLVARYLSFKRIKISLSTLIAFQRITLSRPTHRETFPTGARGMFVCHWHFARSHETFAPRQKLRRLNEELRHVPIEPLLTAASSLSSSLFFAQRLPRWHVLTWWVWTAARVFLPTS